jgi:lysozyme family protein
MKYENHFEKWFAFMKRWEGGKSSALTDKASQMTDKKVHTNRGIIFPTWQSVRYLLGKDNSYEAFLTMTEEEQKEVAKWFWFHAGGDRYEKGNIAAFMAEELWAGGQGAMMFYQRKFGQKNDGIIGSKTAQAINFTCLASADYWALLHTYKRERYARIIANDASQKANEKGWNNRIDSFEKTFK